ncbi:MAG: histidinol dehydrogenase, partial [Gammaproteobacteria bacterium]|nr:histidinol dehydrogenase [Gammaproteobacteria bacterium]
MLNIKKISSCSEGYSEKLKKHISQRKVNTSNIKDVVKDIISEVRVNGDQAL